MRKVKVNYSTTLNIGDCLNVLIGERVLETEFIHSNRFVCETTGIGSGLGRFFVKDSILNHTMKGKGAKVVGSFMGPLQVWSAGFIEYPKEKEIPLRTEVNVASVRGELTKKRLEGILGRELDATTGDGGLLASCLIEKKVEKEYRLGIIPHLRERDLPIFDKLVAENESIIRIDVADEPMKVLQQIASCECILSSSLHGLIISDSFGIPNQRIIVSERLVGDGYKFDDYYSAFGVEGTSMCIDENSVIDINNIFDNYKISVSAVEQKKNEIIKAFNRFI